MNNPKLKRYLYVTLLLLTLVLGFTAWMAIGPGTDFTEEVKYVYIPSTRPDKVSVLDQLEKERITRYPAMFTFLADRVGYWTAVKPGRYEIRKGMSTAEMVRLLKSGRQRPLNLIITKLRTGEDFARFAGRQLECDSAELIAFLRSPDSVSKLGLDTNTAMTVIIPDTYTVYWNTTASRLFRRLELEKNKFWNEERKQKAKGLGLTPEEVYILASIVEEETNKHDEKPVIASVYLNRLKKGMRLGADPTVKFALKDFAIKRILLKHISESAGSPYNTYKQEGLPPGPICTPSKKSIDAVLAAAHTDYLFFCAKADFSGYHAFARDEETHFRNAAAYRRALDSLQIK